MKVSLEVLTFWKKEERKDGSFFFYKNIRNMRVNYLYINELFRKQRSYSSADIFSWLITETGKWVSVVNWSSGVYRCSSHEGDAGGSTGRRGPDPAAHLAEHNLEFTHSCYCMHTHIWYTCTPRSPPLPWVWTCFQKWISSLVSSPLLLALEVLQVWRRPRECCS